MADTAYQEWDKRSRIRASYKEVLYLQGVRAYLQEMPYETAPRGSHPTAALEAATVEVDIVDVEVVATRMACLVEICRVKCFVISLWFFDKLCDDVVLKCYVISLWFVDKLCDDVVLKYIMLILFRITFFSIYCYIVRRIVMCNVPNDKIALRPFQMARVQLSKVYVHSIQIVLIKYFVFCRTW